MKSRVANIALKFYLFQVFCFAIFYIAYKIVGRYTYGTLLDFAKILKPGGIFGFMFVVLFGYIFKTNLIGKGKTADFVFGILISLVASIITLTAISSIL